MIRRTTLELDEDLLLRAKRVLGCATMRATVEEALRRAAEQGEDEAARRARRQWDYLQRLQTRTDVEVLESEQMWR
jgi:Arc/MetJ family transcription regulator